ncbi:MAG: exodeoxyribonuclease VII large subunit [Candidatus Uhrbacteria bacterium]|nr:exodeoxyribonuclease VII large subunit [Candidatus Uhrbacteria bacterium]
MVMRVLSVSQFLDLVNETLKALSEYEVFGVEGEVSGYRVSQGQWVSFDLKDDESLVNVFMPIWKLKVPVEDGMKVRVTGMARIYQKYGKFSLSAEQVELVGEGALRKALAALRARLEKEGLFDVTRKRSIPRIPHRIALIASRESAAYGDFCRITKERWPLLEIDLYHVVVQGEKAPADVISAVATAQQKAKDRAYDAIVITRGGGSFEELMAFNDESLVRAIHASKIPTVVAIGHERDITLAEEVADIRGSTPTDAARRLVPDQRDIEYEIAAMIGRVSESVEREIQAKRALMDRMFHVSARWLERYAVALERYRTSITDGLDRMMKSFSERVVGTTRLLKSLDPKAVLGRGYAFVRSTSGGVIGSVEGLSRGQSVEVQFKDGIAGASIQVIRKT